MPDSIADTAVVLSLLREALSLLDAPEHARIAAHLRHAINELSPGQSRESSLSAVVAALWTTLASYPPGGLALLVRSDATSPPAGIDLATHR